MSRTPVRDALYRLEREGYLTGAPARRLERAPVRLRQFENFYDLRLILEQASVVAAVRARRAPKASTR